MNHAEKRALTTALDGLKAMLCNPAGEVVITGSLADRQEIASHLGALTYLSNDDAEESEGVDASAPTAGPTLLDDAIRKTIEVLEDMPTHHPHYSIWTDHLTQLLEIERDQLRHPLHRSSYSWIGLDVGGGDDMTVQKITTKASNGRLPPGEYMLHGVGRFADAGSAEPTIHVSDITGRPAPAKDDVVDAEYPPVNILFKRSPDGALVEKSCYKLLEFAVRNARGDGRVLQPRWHYVMHAIGLGSTFANQLCEQFGLDPDEKV